jgi:hypothetical protein
MIGYGAHQGGKLVYHFQTGVGLDVKTAADAVSEQGVSVFRHIQDYVPQLEIHAILAGITIALVAVVLGLSVRRANAAWENRLAEEKAIAAGYRPVGQFAQTKNPLSIPLVYPGWFWILAILAGAATLASGLWIIGILQQPLALLSELKQAWHEGEWRTLIHGCGAPAIVLLSMLLGILLRFAPRWLVRISFLLVILVLVVALQAWTGMLMLFDGPEGPVYRFNQATATRPVVVTIATQPTTRLAEQPMPVPDTTHRKELEAPATSPTSLPVEQ